jgi:two-component system cell cycle sensor histidine kinase/response regulator CckA
MPTDTTTDREMRRCPAGEPPAGTSTVGNEIFRKVFESAAIAVKVVELGTLHIVAANASFQSLLGYSLDELASRPYTEYTHPDDRAAQQEAFSSARSDPRGSSQIVKRYVRKDGSAVWVRKTGSLVRDELGGLLYEVSMAEDVSRERETDQARRDADERYRRIVETTMEGIWLVGVDDRTTFVNEAMARMLEVSVAGMHGRSFFEFCDRADLSMAEQTMHRRRAGASERLEMKLRRDDGTHIHALLSASPIFDESGIYAGALAMVSDVSERVAQEDRRNALEEQLRHSQRLESIGQLVSGIAHDFNNLLLAIRGYGELALQQLERGEGTAAGEDIQDLLSAADRAAQLTRQLLAFGGRQVLQSEVIDLREVVSDMDKLLRHLIGDQVELVTTAPDAPVFVEADRTQLGQVVTNLVVNARDAMPDGGRVTIELNLSGDGKEAVLGVSDNGSGMDAETAAQVFEPFFSTKGVDGSGLGLATVHGIVSQSGGRIVLDTTPGGGSTFSIFLPLSDGEPTPPAAARAELPKTKDTQAFSADVGRRRPDGIPRVAEAWPFPVLPEGVA